jgi:AcrR family transcriptional regulator
LPKGPGGYSPGSALGRRQPAAPYRHFRDRDELVADVALRGFERFAAALERAWNDGRPDPINAVQAMGKAYLVFARDEPAYYAAMFEAGIALDCFRSCTPPVTALGVLRAAAERLAATVPGPKRPPALMMALHIWSTTHGIASLFARGDAGRRSLPMSAEELLEAAILIYLRGLGLPDGRRASDFPNQPFQTRRALT